MPEDTVDNDIQNALEEATEDLLDESVENEDIDPDLETVEGESQEHQEPDDEPDEDDADDETVVAPPPSPVSPQSDPRLDQLEQRFDQVLQFMQMQAQRPAPPPVPVSAPMVAPEPPVDLEELDRSKLVQYIHKQTDQKRKKDLDGLQEMVRNALMTYGTQQLGILEMTLPPEDYQRVVNALQFQAKNPGMQLTAARKALESDSSADEVARLRKRIEQFENQQRKFKRKTKQQSRRPQAATPKPKRGVPKNMDPKRLIESVTAQTMTEHGMTVE